MSEWILKAEELLQEGYVLLEKDEVWTRREKDRWLDNDGKRRGFYNAELRQLSPRFGDIASPHINIQKDPMRVKSCSFLSNSRLKALNLLIAI